MNTLKHIKKIRFLLTSAVAGVLLVSCGSYQQASYYDSDGIYGDATDYSYSERPQNNRAAQSSSSSNYEAYFARQSEQFEQITSNDYIFTDIDSYSSNEVNDSTDIVADNYNYNYQGGYPGWGDNPQSTSVNIYNNSWGWGNWYGAGWGGWYGPGWGMGWYDPYWGAGWGGWYGP